MSIEIHVLFSGKLPSKTALARAMRELGFPLTIAADVGSLETHRGYMPMRLRGEETGVEFDTFNSRADVEDTTEGHDIDPRFDRSANFRWGGDEMEMLAGLCTAAALAKLVDGVVLDDEQDRLLTPDKAAASAKRHLESHLGKAEPPGGTRPADLKRYLKPLLELRSDLVLVGRMLLIRPVRHLLRGAFFDPSPSDKYSLYLHPYVDPLYLRQGPHGYHDRIHDALWYVWQPHFQSLLIDCLAEDVFAQLGKVTTLDDFAALPYETGPFLDAQMMSLFLIGGRDHAEEYVRRIERDDSVEEHWKRIFREQLNQVTGDVDTICAQAHAREAETVRKLKLERFWEPSPFPVELPASERAAKAAEPFFPVEPWITRPESLIAEAPDSPGEIRYAKTWFRRDGRLILAAVLTPQAADERHWAHEQYTLLVRLPDGFLFLINRNSGDRNEPARFGFKSQPQGALWAWLEGSVHYVVADFSRKGAGLFALWALRVHERSSRHMIWQCHIDLGHDEKAIHAHTYTKTALTSAERDLVVCELPAFGEYAALADRIRWFLLVAGYGVLT